MMQAWNAEAVRFMQNASEYGTHYESLAAELMPYLPANGHICDAGCGLGYLAVELAKKCRLVTAVDRSKAALSAMKERPLPENLHIVHGDIFAMEECFDAIVMCYFGNHEEILQLAPRCRGNMIVVRRDCSQHKFSLGEVARGRKNTSDLRQALCDRGIPFEAKTLHIEVGQPFVNLEDAMDFFRLYNKSDRRVERGEVLRRLEPTDREDFPWYLPGQRDMELTVFLGRK